MATVTPPGTSVSAFDAKNRMGSLLDRVQAGEELIITRHGHPVARLIPMGKDSEPDWELALKTFERIRRALQQRGVTVTQEEIRSWRNEGRR